MPDSTYKIAFESDNGFGAIAAPVPVNEFNQIIWNDPRVSDRLSTGVQAAMSGLVTGAAYQDGRKSNLVTPLDMGRIAAGMGGGYISGAIVGKALGTLMGMPQETQDFLKNTGVYAGILTSLAPIVFRR